MTERTSIQKKTRRVFAARLFLYFCVFLTGLILLGGGAEYALSCRPSSRLLQKTDAPVPSPAPSATHGTSDAKPPLNLNAASCQDLLGLPGVGPATASAILQFRETVGSFHYPEELMDIKGVGEKTFRRLAPLIFCGPAPETEKAE